MTQVIERTLDPEWSYESVVADFATDDALEFTVYDKDWAGDDDLLGSVLLPCDKFFPDGFEGDLDLTNTSGAVSTITVKVKVLDDKPLCELLLPRWQKQEDASTSESPKRSSFATGMSAKFLKSPVAEQSSMTAHDLLAKTPDPYVLKPDSSRRLVWDILGIFVLLLDLIWIPMQVFEPPDTLLIITLGWVSLLYWTLDVFVTFNTGFNTNEGKLILKRRSIFLRYIRGWFFFDFFLIGIDWAMIVQAWVDGDAAPEGNGSSKAARAGKLARVFRIMRLLRLMRLAKLRQLLFTIQSFIDSELVTIVFAVGKNLSMILALNHYSACVWFLLSKSDPDEIGWVYGGEGSTLSRIIDQDYGFQYLVALHWSLAQFTPGASPIRPSTLPERWYAIAVLALGMVVSTCFVSNITSTLSSVWAMNRYAATQSFLLKKFLSQSKISRSLGSRVTKYIESVIELRHKKVHASKVLYLNMLSGPLNVELQTEMWWPHLDVHPNFHLFYSVSRSAASEVCASAIQHNVCGKREVVFKAFAEATCMFFVCGGSLAFRHYQINPFGEYLPMTNKLEAKEWCSEGALWSDWTHRGQLKAITYAEMLWMDSQKFADATTQSDDAFTFLRACALHFVSLVDDMTVDVPVELIRKKMPLDLKNANERMVDESENAEVDKLSFDEEEA
jgi:hypothetical protein